MRVAPLLQCRALSVVSRSLSREVDDSPFCYNAVRCRSLSLGLEVDDDNSTSDGSSGVRRSNILASRQTDVLAPTRAKKYTD